MTSITPSSGDKTTLLKLVSSATPGEQEAAKVLSDWRGKSFIVDAATAAFRLGALVSASYLTLSRAAELLQRHFELNGCDPDAWSQVQSALYSGREVVVNC